MVIIFGNTNLLLSQQLKSLLYVQRTSFPKRNKRYEQVPKLLLANPSGNVEMEDFFLQKSVNPLNKNQEPPKSKQQ